MRAALVPPGLKEFLDPSQHKPTKTKSGRKPILNLEDLKAAFEIECRTKGCAPTDDGPEGWRSQADLEGWVTAWAAARRTPIAEATARNYARTLLRG